VGESVEIWRASLDDVITLVEPLDDSAWGQPTPCPGWTVGDVVAHIIDLEAHFSGDPRPDHEPDWEELPHVSTDMQKFIEVGVDARRGRTPAQLRAELHEVTERRAAQLRDADLQQPVMWFVGEIPLERLLGMRAFDIWTHEQDIRSALGIPGGLDSAGARVAWGRIRDTLPFIWGKKVGSTQTLRVVVTPPGPSGTLTLAPVEDRIGYDDSATPDIEVQLAWKDLAARAAGRVPADQVTVTVVGDNDLARRLLQELAFTP
jgi:uncharacterized protein (TIGR03083 family)